MRNEKVTLKRKKWFKKLRLLLIFKSRRNTNWIKINLNTFHWINSQKDLLVLVSVLWDLGWGYFSTYSTITSNSGLSTSQENKLAGSVSSSLKQLQYKTKCKIENKIQNYNEIQKQEQNTKKNTSIKNNLKNNNSKHKKYIYFKIQNDSIQKKTIQCNSTKDKKLETNKIQI